MNEEYNYPEMEQNAKKIVNFFKSNNLDSSVKTSRYRKEIKVVEIFSKLDYNQIFEEIKMLASISDLNLEEEKSISGKYKSKLIEVNKDIPGILKKGDKFLILNKYTEKGTLSNKQVSPEKLGLAEKKYKSTTEFDKAVISGIEKLKVELTVRKTLKSLYENIMAGSRGNSIAYSKETKTLMDLLKPQDRQAIGKDFGEVLSLRWYVSNFPGWTEFGFSTVSNAPLVDYSVKYKDNLVNISAKFEQGAAPSIRAILTSLDKAYPNPNNEEKRAIKIIKLLGSDSGTTSHKIFNVFKELNLPGYKQLQDITKKQSLSLDDINNKIKESVKISNTKSDRIDHFIKSFQSFYSALGKDKLKTQELTSLDTVFSSISYGKYYSMIVSPMGYYLISYMNSTPIFQEILNNTSRMLEVEQVYLYFTPTSIDLKKKLFSNSKYKFSYGGNLKNSDNTGIKFEMLK